MSCVEFQVVVLAGGKANKLYPLSETDPALDSSCTPLCTLPISNRPLISFQLELLEKSGFTEAIVVSHKSTAAKLRTSLEHYRKMRIDIVEADDELGSADALRLVKDKITTDDFIVLSGDLVTDIGMHHLADIHRVQDASVTALLKELPPPSEATKKQRKGHEEREIDFIGLDQSRQRIMFMKNADDVDDERLRIRKSVLARGAVTVHRNIMDAHLYVFKRWVLDLLDEKKNIVSIKKQLVPFLVKNQFRPRRTQKTTVDGSEGEAEVSVLDRVKRLQSFAQSLSTSKGIPEDDNIRCMAYVINDFCYCRRANYHEEYVQLNRDISRPGVTQFKPFEPLSDKGDKFVATSVEIEGKTQIGTECTVGEQTRLGDRCSVKRSNIGGHCKIGNNVKIVNSVVMDHVTIEDKCQIIDSVVCSNSIIGQLSSITSCRVAHHYNMPAETSEKDRVFIAH